MREHVSQKKQTTTGFSIPSLKHPTRGFGLESSAISRQAVPELQSLHKPLTHDINRIPLRNPQAKLSISQPGDKYEQEADSVAQQVMQTMAQPVNRQSIQREALPEDESELQMMPMVQRQASMAATPDLETSINQARDGGQSMADNIRQPMEQAFGDDFSGVKIHTDGQSDQLNRSIQARAFTTGQDVFFRQGEYNPGSRGGQELLAHELTHVVQQTGKERKVQRKKIEGGFTSTTNFRDITNTGTFATAYTTSGNEVTQLIKEIRTHILAGRTPSQKLIVLSGCHGDNNGNLYAEGGFYWEDVENEMTGKMPINAKDMRRKSRNMGWAEIDNPNVLIVLGWCYSQASYNNWQTITADWQGF